MLQLAGITVSLLLGIAADPEPAGSSVFQLKDGDRVVFVGNTLIERAAQYGLIETLLTLTHPDAKITFRNLGYSGDTVWAESRAGFDTPTEGFARLKESVNAARPTLIFVGYGGNEAFAGRAGLPRFVVGIQRLLDVLSATGARVVLLSPIRHEDLGRPLPDPVPHNRNLRIYANTMRNIAKQRACGWIELDPVLSVRAIAQPSVPLTENGMHLNAYGYWRAAEVIARSDPTALPNWRVTLAADGRVVETSGTQIRDASHAGEMLKWIALDKTLPSLPNPHAALLSYRSGPPQRELKVTGLNPGNYRLKIDDQVCCTATANQWNKGVAITAGPEFAATEQLRQAILQKNKLFFYRWRPQNTTYLFGFRKHEQGNNAAEVVQFDPLIAQSEKEIVGLRRPVEHRYELSKQSEVSR